MKRLKINAPGIVDAAKAIAAGCAGGCRGCVGRFKRHLAVAEGAGSAIECGQFEVWEFAGLPSFVVFHFGGLR